MQARIPLMIQDPTTSKRYGGLGIGGMGLEGFNPKKEEFFLSGPISKQVAVLDFSPETGELVEGAKWHKPPLEAKIGWYVNEKGKRLDKYKELDLADLTTPAFLQVNAFATVLKTIYMLRESEKEKDKDKGDTLGRSITWANRSPQLLVIPRAGRMKNAFYSRDSNSLQFFMFSPADNPNQTVYTCLYRDIVAHETGHAIVDGIAPDLYDSQQNQALAIHESIADLTALLMAISSWPLSRIVLNKNHGNIKNSTDFSTIAADWRTELEEGGRHMRDLLNEKNLNPESENCVKSDECHELSEVLSGALYKVLVKMHEDFKDQLEPHYAKDPRSSSDPRYYASRSALYDYAAERFKQMIFRALDYLPPGDISFIDYGRALAAADSVGYQGEECTRKICNWIKTEFFERNIISDKVALDVPTFFEDDALKGVNISNLHKSDWVAYQFANSPKGRSLLCIPPDIPFEVLSPRLEVRKKPIGKPPLYNPADIQGTHECIFKVAWDAIEKNPIGPGYPEKRRVRIGTTLVLYWENGLVLTLLTTAPPHETNTKHRYVNEKQRSAAADEYERKQESRTNFMKCLIEEGLLKFNQHSFGPDGRTPLLSCVQAEDLDGIMRIKGSGKMLHIIAKEKGIVHG
jgi:hypothetical protein